MGKTKKSSRAPRHSQKAEVPPNAFERIHNKKRFDILGRKTKGDTRHVGQLRSAATQKRKDTLLIEYKQLGKANAFLDRRFGEDDDTLTAEEKALLRFQKQRIKDASGGRFSLQDADDINGNGNGGGDQYELTHLGRSLADDLTDAPDGWNSDDDGAFIDPKLEADLNFGGGLFQRKHPSDNDNNEYDNSNNKDNRHRSKKEIMEEVIAKSKAYKAAKREQREDDINETDKLDSDFQSLLDDKSLLGLMMKKKGERNSSNNKIAIGEGGEGRCGDANNTIDDDKRFDVLTRELVFEAKSRPGEKAPTSEELAEAEHRRLKAAETAQLKRMQHGGGEDQDGSDDDEGDGGGFEGGRAKGGYAARRAKRARAEEDDGDSDLDARRKKTRNVNSADALEDDFDLDDSDGEDGSDDDDDDEGLLTALEMRRRERAGGDHPLQQTFKEASAKLLAKYGITVDGGEDEDEEEDGSDDGNEGEEEGSSSSEEEETSSSEDDEEEEEAAAAIKTATATNKKTTYNKDEEELQPTIPFTPSLPDSYEDFQLLVAALSPSDLNELVRRTRVCNATALSTGNRKAMQMFYGILVQHFANISSSPTKTSSAIAEHAMVDYLNALLPHILEMTPLVPFYAATLARARLLKAHETMVAALADPIQKAKAWPVPRTLALLKLFSTVFPVSDKRHAVLTPASLLITSALANCPLARGRDVGTGLYLAGMAVHLHSQAKRYCPEPLVLCTLLLESITGSGGGSGEEEDEQPSWLAIITNEDNKKNSKNNKKKNGSDGTASLSEEEVAPLSLSNILQRLCGDEDESYWTSTAFKVSASAAAIKIMVRCAELWSDVDAVPEIFSPSVSILKKISSSLVKTAPAIKHLAKEAASKLETITTAAMSKRRPLINPSVSKAPEAKTFNPRFEDDFATGKDYDPDRERSERRKLQKMVRREERGAIRELRRDGSFMADVRNKEKEKKQGELDGSARRAMAFLQQQEADFKSGGQGGMWKKKKRK